MPTPSDLDDIARELKQAQDNSAQITPASDRFPGFDLAAGYAVGERIHRLRVAEGDLPVGRKVGMTLRSRWPELGVSAPIWAWLRQRSVRRFRQDDASLSLAPFCQPKIEPELVVHFRNAPPAGADEAAMIAAIDWVAPGIEIVQTHYRNGFGKPPDSLADCAHHAALLIGTPMPVDQLGSEVVGQMTRLSVRLCCGGTLRETGTAENVLGSPLTALCEIATIMAAHGAPLAAGEVVTTGTITTPCPIAVGETWEVTFDGIALPALSVRFE
ncbi:MAG TPA: fumarylacetoacetate hydrolase family protein [Rhodocyclaceae bacterium]